MGERRGFERFGLSGNAHLLVLGQHDKDAGIDAALENISFGGLGLIGPASLAVGARLRFSLTTPAAADAILSGTGIVRHAACAGDGAAAGPGETDGQPRACAQLKFGIQFDDVDKDAVVYLIGRIQVRRSDSLRGSRGIRPVDFLPY